MSEAPAPVRGGLRLDGDDQLAQQLAPRLCDAFFATAQMPTRWATAAPDQRRAFTLCAMAALQGGRHAARARLSDREGHIAASISVGFWAAAPEPPPGHLTWPGATPQVREVFRSLAREAIRWGAEARELRAGRLAA